MNNITTKILAWYQTNRRDLPWRQTSNPYKIWLSEVILQQTRVAQGLPYYHRFVNVFPNVESLASASETEVLREWQGLGYYSRARNMLRCARLIEEQYHGNYPDTYDELLQLPGVGPYTAAAVASIAFGRPNAVVDGNVIRVLSRLFGEKAVASSGLGRKAFQERAQELLPRQRPGEFNQAIMEFGALQCRPQPLCATCPLSAVCYANEFGEQKKLPAKPPKIRVKTRHFHYLVWTYGDKVLLRERGPNDIWQGLYDFHLVESQRMEDFDTVVNQLDLAGFPGKSSLVIKDPARYKHILSHQRIMAVFFPIELVKIRQLEKVAKAQDLRIFSWNQVEQLPKPILITKFLNERIF